MRASRLLLPTLRDDPADAVAASHRLLVRAGYVRQVGSGLWSFMPLGFRSLQRVISVIREEMDAIGCQELLMPVLLPEDLLRKTGRNTIPELFKLQDRKGSELVLAMTHEETIALHAAGEIRSYRDLPQTWYQFQTKERDEPRPQGGLLRTREFIMKDAYSLDRDQAGLQVSYDAQAGAYRRIFERARRRWSTWRPRLRVRIASRWQQTARTRRTLSLRCLAPRSRTSDHPRRFRSLRRRASRRLSSSRSTLGATRA